jgi:tRNA modification GTPase
VTLPVRVALLTPVGRSALATFALIGEGAFDLAKRLFRPAHPAPWTPLDLGPRYGHFGNDPSDDVVITIRPQSAEPVIEVHCHGGLAMVRSLIDQVVDLGASLTTWQQFEQSAGASIIQVEAMDALGQATATRSAQILLDQLHGALDQAISQIKQNRDHHQLEQLQSWEQLGSHLVQPWRVALFGEPNVGKSSLLNALAGFERAIVSPTAGTTRDLLSVDVTFDGWPFRLFDGAGLQTTTDPIEQEGIIRVSQEIARADLRIRVVDLSIPPAPSQSLEADMTIGNKSDLPSPWTQTQLQSLAGTFSARTGENIDVLINTIVQQLIPTLPAPGQAIPFTARQRDELAALSRRFKNENGE